MKCECENNRIEYAYPGMVTYCDYCEGDLDVSNAKCFRCQSKVVFSNMEKGTWHCDYCSSRPEITPHTIKVIFENDMWHLSCNDITTFIAIKNRIVPDMKKESKKILKRSADFHAIAYGNDLYINVKMLMFLADKFGKYELMTLFQYSDKRHLEKAISDMVLNPTFCIKADYANPIHHFAYVYLHFSEVERNAKPFDPVSMWNDITKY